mmetsp:Transcript_22577/g.59612  ORF Transcript_22577/g.59612 Transcript_22577/m.59612 type:complete len:366 (-) Transcript_22577:888-1985(-)
MCLELHFQRLVVKLETCLISIQIPYLALVAATLPLKVGQSLLQRRNLLLLLLGQSLCLSQRFLRLLILLHNFGDLGILVLLELAQLFSVLLFDEGHIVAVSTASARIAVTRLCVSILGIARAFTVVPRVSKLLQIKRLRACGPPLVRPFHHFHMVLEPLRSEHVAHNYLCLTRAFFGEVLRGVNIVSPADEEQPILDEAPSRLCSLHLRHFADDQFGERPVWLAVAEGQWWSLHRQFVRHVQTLLHSRRNLVRFVHLQLRLLHHRQEASQHHLILLVKVALLTQLAVILDGDTGQLGVTSTPFADQVSQTVKVLLQLVLHGQKLPSRVFREVAFHKSDAETVLLALSEHKPVTVLEHHRLILYQS